MTDISTSNLRDDDNDSLCDRRRRNRRTESFKSPSISSAHRNHKGERGGGGKEYWEDSRNEGGAGRCVCLWGGMVDDGRGSCFSTSAIHRGIIAEIGLIDEATGLRLRVLARSGGLMSH